MPKAIIFDCWNTLFTHDVNFECFAQRIGQSFSDYRFLKKFEKHFMLKKHDFLEEPVRSLLYELGVDPSPQVVRDLVRDLNTCLASQRPFPETLEVLARLKEKHKLGLITNTFSASFDPLKINFRLEDIFDAILRSDETCLLKPDLNMFSLMARKLKVKKSEMLMVGDSLKDDVMGAQAAGLKAVLIDRRNKHPDFQPRITSLVQIFEHI